MILRMRILNTEGVREAVKNPPDEFLSQALDLR